MASDTPTPAHIAKVYMNTLSLKSDPASWWAHTEIQRLRAELVSKADELAAAIKERDEARRWFCFEARRASDGKNSETYAKQIADMFFWDCFAKEGGGA